MPSKHDPAASFADILENLERICEAAFRLEEKAAELAPSQPWGDIRGLGNRLRQAYDRIDLDILWNTVRDRLPSLKADAQQALLGLKAKGDRGAAVPDNLN